MRFVNAPMLVSSIISNESRRDLERKAVLALNRLGLQPHEILSGPDLADVGWFLAGTVALSP